MCTCGYHWHCMEKECKGHDQHWLKVYFSYFYHSFFFFFAYVFIFSSLAVSVIPEGLVAVTTVTMALGVRRMAAK